MAGTDRDRLVEELFLTALDLSGAERTAFLDARCGDDTELRTEVEELLAEDAEGTKDWLVSPVLAAREETHVAIEGGEGGEGAGSARPSPGKSYMPERIGRYLIRERIGEGGMGSVYLAEQERPVRREVALKIVKPGMDTERVIERFERAYPEFDEGTRRGILGGNMARLLDERTEPASR